MVACVKWLFLCREMGYRMEGLIIEFILRSSGGFFALENHLRIGNAAAPGPHVPWKAERGELVNSAIS